MGYPEQFKHHREACGLTREQLADKANCHRNTVINIETGRPVKFGTMMQLMEHMGFRTDSSEVRFLALLWLEAATGIQVSPAQAENLQAEAASGAHQLQHEISRRRLSHDDVDLLSFAARNRKVLNALRAIRELVPDTVR